MTEGDQECIGFTVRPATPASAGIALRPQPLHEGIDFLARQLGELPLSALIREAAALAERHFVEQALRRAEGDVDAAALLLGVERTQITLARAADEITPNRAGTLLGDTGGP
jgi:DNA-binding NtrC family response regulator